MKNKFTSSLLYWRQLT